MSTAKNPTAVRVGQRIKQARRMAGLDTADQLLNQLSDWGRSRLGNYEAGISLPSPDDIERLAQATGTSPCWLMFGSGPIRASGREQQSIRHQNLAQLVQRSKVERQLTALLKNMGISRKKLDEYLENPFLNIPDRIARRTEKYIGKKPGWMDEQHVESDPICRSFPDDMLHLMTIYSNLDNPQRKLLLSIADTIANEAGKSGS